MNYILKTGYDGVKRLESVHGLYGEESFRLLETVGLKSSARVLDAGCGTGQMSAWISNKIGKDGAVIAVDSSYEQLMIARENLNSLNNVTFICKSIEDLTIDDVGNIDILYVRLVLVHSKSPSDFINGIKKICNKNTIVVFEEPVTRSSFCYPQSVAFDTHLALYQQLGELSGLDFNIGEKLIETMALANIRLQGVRKIQRAFNSKQETLIAYRRTFECYDKYLKYKLIEKSDLDNLLSELNNLSTKNFFVSGVSMTQAWGIFI